MEHDNGDKGKRRGRTGARSAPDASDLGPNEQVVLSQQTSPNRTPAEQISGDGTLLTPEGLVRNAPGGEDGPGGARDSAGSARRAESAGSHRDRRSGPAKPGGPEGSDAA